MNAPVTPSAIAAGQGADAQPVRRNWIWFVLVIATAILPWLFYDWNTGRHSGFLLTMLSQMGMMIIFSLSYNMLMGQAGLLSFGHAVFFGLGGYSTIHFLNAAEAGTKGPAKKAAPKVGRETK